MTTANKKGGGREVLGTPDVTPLSAPIVGRELIEDAGMNNSIEDVVTLMQAELERLTVALETLRLTGATPAQIRWHIAQIDQRQLSLDELLKLIQH